jgi:large subunit ribosomal protein L31
MEVDEMRSGIHPDYVECKVRCSCGNEFITRSTKAELHVELCNACHPFYTGQQKFVDTGGRVQRFSDKFGGAADSVMARAEAAKKQRQQAHEESETKIREARVAREVAMAAAAEKVEKSERRARVDAATEAVAAEILYEAPVAAAEPIAAEVAEEPVAVEEPIAVETADEPTAEVVEEPAAEATDAPAEETSEEPAG